MREAVMDRRNAITLGAAAGLGGLLPARPDQQYYPAAGGQQIPGARTPIRARLVIISGTGPPGSGLYDYTPAPGAGNLVATILPLGGFDSFHNAVLQGITAYSQAAQFAACQIVGGIIQFRSAASQAGPWSFGATIAGDNTGDLLLAAAGTGHIKTTGLFDAQQGAQVELGLTVASGGASVTGGLTTDTALVTTGKAGGLLLQVINTTGGTSGAMCSYIVQTIGDSWFRFRVSGDTANRMGFDWTPTNQNPRLHFGSGAAAPDTTIYRASANLFGSDYIAYDAGNGLAEAWNAPTFINGWANAALAVPLEYRRVAAPNNCVQLIGDITAPAGIVAGQNIINALPAGYRPARAQFIDCTNGTGPKSALLLMTTGGQLQFSAGAVAGDVLHIPACNLVALTA